MKSIGNYMVAMHNLVSNATFDASSRMYQYWTRSFLPHVTRLITTLKILVANQ